MNINFLEKLETFILSNKILLLIITAVFLLRIPSLLEPMWYGDEAIYVTIGQKINNGGLLYVDIFDHKTPGIYYLAAWALKFLGETIWSFKFLLTLWIIPTLIAFYFLAKEIFDKRTAIFSVLTLAVLTTTPAFEGNIVNSEILMILPTTLGFLFGLKKKYFIAGIFFSLSILLKFPGIFDFGAFFIFVALSLNKERFLVVFENLVKLTLGLAIPFGLTFIYFAFQGALSTYINTAFLFNLTYINYGNEFIIKNGLLVVKALPLIAVAFYFFWRVFSKNGKRLNHNVGVKELLVIWLMFSYYGAIFGGRPYIHYLIQPIAPLSIIIGRTLSSTEFRKLGLSLTVITIVLSLLLGFLPNLNPTYYTNFFKFVFNRTTTQEYRNSFDSNTSRNYSIANFVTGCLVDKDVESCEKLRSTEDDQIYVWANQPSVYFLSQRDPATKYITAFHILGSDSAKKETILELRKKEPKFIIVDDKGPTLFSELDSLIKRRYNLFAVSEDYSIYELSDSSKIN